MRQVGLGIVVVMLVTLGAVGWSSSSSPLQAQQVPPAVKPLMLADGLIALSSDTADGHQQIAVIETKSRVMSVYHIEHKTGTITLKSVRSLAADLEMDEFNTEHPLPRDIRAILNKR
jgi:hypothetical protein